MTNYNLSLKEMELWHLQMLLSTLFEKDGVTLTAEGKAITWKLLTKVNNRIIDTGLTSKAQLEANKEIS